MAHHSIGDVGDGHLGNWGFQEGGMGAVADAIAARRPGERCRDPHRRTGRAGSSSRTAGRPASCWRRASRSPRRWSSPRCTPAPRSWTTSAGTNLPDDFVTDIEHWKTRSGVVKINLALAELPDFTADPGTNLQEHHTGSVEMAPTMQYIEQRVHRRPDGTRRPTRPFSDGVIPTAFDKTLCPEGYHIMSLFTQWVPSDWSSEPHTGELQAYADRMIDCYNEVAPNFKSSILHTDIVGPYEMEHDYGLIGGNIFHGELSLEQLFHMRPAPGSPTTARRCPACTTPAPRPTPAAACAASPACRRPGRPSPTAAPPPSCVRAAAGEPRPAPATTAAVTARPGHARPQQRRPRAAVTAMLEARSVALVGASAAPAASASG